VEEFDLNKEDGRNAEDVISTNSHSSVEFEVLIAVIERNYIFWEKSTICASVRETLCLSNYLYSLLNLNI
jgi:hypothetical protein